MFIELINIFFYYFIEKKKTKRGLEISEYIYTFADLQ